MERGSSSAPESECWPSSRAFSRTLMFSLLNGASGLRRLWRSMSCDKRSAQASPAGPPQTMVMSDSICGRSTFSRGLRKVSINTHLPLINTDDTDQEKFLPRMNTDNTDSRIALFQISVYPCRSVVRFVFQLSRPTSPFSLLQSARAGCRIDCPPHRSRRFQRWALQHLY